MCVRNRGVYGIYIVSVVCWSVMLVSYLLIDELRRKKKVNLRDTDDSSEDDHPIILNTLLGFDHCWVLCYCARKVLPY